MPPSTAPGVVAPRAAGWELDWWIGADDRWHVPGARGGGAPAPGRRHAGGADLDAGARRGRGAPCVRRALSPMSARSRWSRSPTSRPPRSSPRSWCGARARSTSATRPPVRRRAQRGAHASPARRGGRWPSDGSTEEIVTSGAASDAPFAPRRDRGARLVAAFLYPVAHRTTLRAAVAIGTRGLGATEPGHAARRSRGGAGMARLSSTGACASSCPTTPLQRAVDTARAATVLAGQAWKVVPEVVAVLEDWGLDAEAATGWARLTGRDRRRLARRTPPPPGGVGRGARPGGRARRRAARRPARGAGA